MSFATLPERVLVLGDIHQEDERLASALALLREGSVAVALSVGDVVDGRGSLSNTLALLSRHRVETVRGNHERWLASGELRELEDAVQPSDVTDGDRAFLSLLPVTRAYSTPYGGLLLCHGLGDSDMAKVDAEDEGYALDTNDALLGLRSDARYRFVVNGHTHRALVRHFPDLTVINAGTLRGEDEPGCLILDFHERLVRFHRFVGGRLVEHAVRDLCG